MQREDMQRQDPRRPDAVREEWMPSGNVSDVICAWLSALLIIVPVCLLA
jgi:hypothetical protein